MARRPVDQPQVELRVAGARARRSGSSATSIADDRDAGARELGREAGLRRSRRRARAAPAPSRRRRLVEQEAAAQREVAPARRPRAPPARALVVVARGHRSKARCVRARARCDRAAHSFTNAAAKRLCCPLCASGGSARKRESRVRVAFDSRPVSRSARRRALRALPARGAARDGRRATPRSSRRHRAARAPTSSTRRGWRARCCTARARWSSRCTTSRR